MISRANPALRETDRVLAILARQNQVLANLARDSDAALAPLAREKKAVSDFIVQANRTGEATAERRADIERGIERLPRFLRELRPLMADLGGFAGQATPVARDLNESGTDVSRLIQALGPFSTASTPSLTSLGDAAGDRPPGADPHPAADPGPRRRSPSEGRPLSKDLDKPHASLDKTGGIERLMDFLFFSMTSINGFDGVGHYLRAALGVNLCTPYAPTPAPGCNANFTATRAIGAAASAQAGHQRPRSPSSRGRPATASRAACLPRARCSAASSGTSAGVEGRPRATRADPRGRAGSGSPAFRVRRADARLPAGETASEPGARESSGLAASPVLVGAVTLLVSIVAVFLSYNANSGLPFVPTYDLRVQLPNAANLVRGNEVRIGGARVGVIDKIDAVPHGDEVNAIVDAKLDKDLEPLPVDSTFIVRPRSALGLKYVELTPGIDKRASRPAPRCRCRRPRPTRSRSTRCSTSSTPARGADPSSR